MLALGGQYSFICSFDLLEDPMYQLPSFSQTGPKSEGSDDIEASFLPSHVPLLLFPNLEVNSFSAQSRLSIYTHTLM